MATCKDCIHYKACADWVKSVNDEYCACAELIPCKNFISTANVAPRAEVAREIFEEIEEGLKYEIDLEDKRGRNAWAQGDVSGFQTHDYAEDKLDTLLTALSLLKKKYTGGEDTNVPAKKDYYTPEEVRNMSHTEISNNLTVIRESMKRWREK